MSARHLATVNLWRNGDNSLSISFAEADGVLAELNGSGAPLHLCAMNALRAAVMPPPPEVPAIDPRTGRPAGDHGKASDAIAFALDVADLETPEFLRAWREGDLDEWPEFYAWLHEREGRASTPKPTPAELGFVEAAAVPVGAMRRSIHRSHRGEGHNFVD